MKLIELIKKLQEIEKNEGGEIDVCNEFEVLIELVEVNGPKEERYVIIMSGEE